MADLTNEMKNKKEPGQNGFDRKLCKECLCATCYEQEFCGRCETCAERSRLKTSCGSYEGAYNY